jgi:FkbM family methyltransferase
MATSTERGIAVLRLFYKHLKLRRGINRVLTTVFGQFGSLQLLPVRMSDGRILYLDLRERMCMPYLLTGEIPYERYETEFVRSVIRSGDVVVDIGANVGWYSTLLSELVGSRGRVYAFEPSRKALAVLRASSDQYPQLQVVAAALTDHEGEEQLHIPVEAAMGSLRASQHTVMSQKCRVTTLDRFLQNEGIVDVAFVKCDTEGAELEILHGAVRTLSADRPPMWMMELNASATQRFGYQPDRLVEFFEMFSHAGYQSYGIHPQMGRLESLSSPISIEYLNAVFVPTWLEDRITVYRERYRTL